MKKIILASCLIFMFLAGNAFAEQLAWIANTESDLFGYTVYRCSDETIESCLRVDDPMENLVTTSDTCYPLSAVDYGYYFRVSASDFVLNESELSDAVYYEEYVPPDTTPPAKPGTPFIDRDNDCLADLNNDGTVNVSDFKIFWDMYKLDWRRIDCLPAG